MLWNRALRHTRKRSKKPPARRARTRYRAVVECLEDRFLLSAGDFDPSFGGGDGEATVGFEVTALVDEFSAVTRLADGKLLAAGSAADGFSRYSPDITLARYNANGTLDAAFGSGGKAVIDFGGGYESRERAFDRDAE